MIIGTIVRQRELLKYVIASYFFWQMLLRTTGAAVSFNLQSFDSAKDVLWSGVRQSV